MPKKADMVPKILENIQHKLGDVERGLGELHAAQAQTNARLDKLIDIQTKINDHLALRYDHINEHVQTRYDDLDKRIRICEQRLGI